MTFSKEIYDNSYITERKEFSKHYLELKYKGQFDDGATYTLFFNYNTDEEYMPTSLLSISIIISAKDYEYTFSYVPLFHQEYTDLFDALYYDNTGYYYIKGYEFSKDDLPKPSKETYGLNINSILSPFIGKVDFASEYDFTMKYYIYGGDPYVYIYDSNINTVALYNADYYDEAEMAIDNNDFVTYLPNIYAFNDTNSYLNVKTGQEHYLYYDYYKYTIDDEDVSNVIINAFSNFEFYDDPDYRLENNEVKIIFSYINELIDDEFAKCVVYCEKKLGSYNPYKMTINSSLSGLGFELTVYFNNVFDIVIP